MQPCFRACDIRGIYPGEVNENLCYEVGRRLPGTQPSARAVMVAHDPRASSPALKAALIRGLAESGAQVLDCGLVPTPVLRFGVLNSDSSMGVVVTASHNPPSHNGLKLISHGGDSSPEQLVTLQEALGQPPPVAASGDVRNANITDAYEQYMLDRWRPVLLRLPSAARRIVIDPGNGAWSSLGLRILRQLGLNATAIHDTADGSFPNRSPDCAQVGALARLADSVVSTGACIGVAWDGDGDRVAFCDRSGAVVGAERIAMVLIPRCLEVNRGASVLMDVKASRRVLETVLRNGGRPLLEGSAHCRLERAMATNNCIFGCEYSGHYFFRELRGGDDGLHAALLVIEQILATGLELDQLTASQAPLFITPDIRIPGDERDFSRIISRLASSFPNGHFDWRDGLKAELSDGWVLVRRSVSESKITIRIEGDSEARLCDLIEIMAAVAPEHAAVIRAGHARQRSAPPARLSLPDV